MTIRISDDQINSLNKKYEKLLEKNEEKNYHNSLHYHNEDSINIPNLAYFVLYLKKIMLRT